MIDMIDLNDKDKVRLIVNTYINKTRMDFLNKEITYKKHIHNIDMIIIFLVGNIKEDI